MRNPNVRLALLYYVLVQAAQSLYSQNPLAALVEIIDGGDDAAVGVVTGAQGVANLLAAIPAGILADRYRRDFALRIAACVGICAAALSTYTLWYAKRQHEHDENEHNTLGQRAYVMLVLSYACWGVFNGSVSGPLEALFGDSVETGSRSFVYQLKSALRTAGNAIGPLISIVIFSVRGDVWRVDDLSLVMFCGLALTVCPIACLFFFSDEKSLGAESEAFGAADTDEITTPLVVEDEDEDDDEDEDAEAPRRCQSTDSMVSDLGSPATDTRPFKYRVIPYLVATSDMLTMLGSGMTIRFFALFFKNAAHMSPSAVQAVFVVVPLGISVCAMGAQRLAARLGRCGVVILCRIAGVSLLVAMTVIDPTKNKVTLLVVYIARSWLMNCHSGLTKSLVNDFVLKRHRGFWNSLESINAFSWCGSAMLGGFLVRMYTYETTFLITAALQGLSIVPIFVLLRIVPAEVEGGVAAPAAEEDSD